MPAPGPQNKFIVFQPVARSGKCFPNEGTCTINSSVPAAGSGPALGKAEPTVLCRAGEDPSACRAPQASRSRLSELPTQLGPLSGPLRRPAELLQHPTGCTAMGGCGVRPWGHVPNPGSISASAHRRLFAPSFLLWPGQRAEAGDALAGVKVLVMASKPALVPQSRGRAWVRLTELFSSFR